MSALVSVTVVLTVCIVWLAVVVWAVGFIAARVRRITDRRLARAIDRLAAPDSGGGG